MKSYGDTILNFRSDGEMSIVSPHLWTALDYRKPSKRSVSRVRPPFTRLITR